MASATTALRVFNETSNYLPPLAALRDFIQKYRLDARKALSQNYLMDMNLSRKIVRKSGSLRDAFVLEIGPGPGGITRAILEQPCRRLDVVELDRQFLTPLEHVQDHSQGRLHIHQGDILRTDIERLWQLAEAPKCDWTDDDPPLRIIGNLPFHISTPLLMKFLNQIALRQGPFTFGRVPMTFTFQSEVAERIVAPLDSEMRSRIGINCQNYTEPKILFEIPGKCFTPRPEVNVCAVHFVPRAEPRIATHFELTAKVLRVTFHFRRKQLQKAIKLLYPEELAEDMAHDLLSHCRLDPRMNVPSLALEDFARICAFYECQCRERAGLFLYNHREPEALEKLAAEPNPFPPHYQRPVDEGLERIGAGGIGLNEFDLHFENRGRREGRERRRRTSEPEGEGRDVDGRGGTRGSE